MYILTIRARLVDWPAVVDWLDLMTPGWGFNGFFSREEDQEIRQILRRYNGKERYRVAYGISFSSAEHLMLAKLALYD